MKKLYLCMLFAFSALVFSGCRCVNSEKIVFDGTTPANMTVQQAQAIITDAFDNPPTGQRPKNPGWKTLARVNTVEYREHLRTGFYLVELKCNSNVMARFYMYDGPSVRKFADALRRIKKEYSAPVK